MHASHAPLAPARRKPGAGLLFLVLSGTLWGTGGLTGSLLSLNSALPPLAVAAYRLAVGGALIIFFLALTGRRLPRGRTAWGRITTIGVLSAMCQACYFAAVSLTSVSVATLITIGAAPALVLAAESAVGRRRADRWSVGPICLALAGLGLLVGVPTGGLTAPAMLGGAGLALLAAGGFAAITLIGTSAVPGLDEMTTTGFGFAVGGLFLIFLAEPTVGMGFDPSVTSITLVIMLGTVPTAVAYTLYFRGLRTVAASTAALVALLEPLTGALLAALILDDRLGAAGISGAALLAAAVTIAAMAPSGRLR
jgi:drug/metabolite transporter, DME family